MSVSLDSSLTIDGYPTTNFCEHRSQYADPDRVIQLNLRMDPKTPRQAAFMMETACKTLRGVRNVVTMLDARRTALSNDFAWSQCLITLLNLDTIHIMPDRLAGPMFLIFFFRRLGGINAPKRPLGSRIPALRHIYLHPRGLGLCSIRTEEENAAALTMEKAAKSASLAFLTQILVAYQEMGITLTIHVPSRYNKGFITPDVKRSFRDLGGRVQTHRLTGRKKLKLLGRKKWVYANSSDESESDSGGEDRDED